MQKFRLLAGIVLTALFLFPALCTAQTMSIVSGNGQLVCPLCEVGSQSFAPLVAQVNDATGKPLPNTTVTWTTTQPGFPTVTSTSQTNSSGQASLTYPVQQFFFGSSFLQGTVVAAAQNTSVQFSEWTGLPGSLSPGAPVNIVLVPQTAPPALVGTVGQTSTTPIIISVTTTSGVYVPLGGVQVRLSSGGAGQPSVSCQTEPGQAPGTVVTDSTGATAGTAKCIPVFGNATGNGNYSIVVGGNYTSFGPATLTVNPGPPALIKIISGNNQTVNPGNLTPLPLTAQVTDLGGNPSNNAAVTWSVTQGSATISHQSTASAYNGYVSANVSPTVGPVQVTVALAANNKVTGVFTVNVNIVATGITIVSGNSQSANENAPFADPLIVQVSNNTAAVQGATVNFAVTSGSATFSSPASAVTNAQGQAQVTVDAGPTAGPVVVTATMKSGSTTLSQTFNLTVNPPGPVITAIVNAASFGGQSVAPCSLATIFGTGLTPGLQGVAEAFIAPQTQVANVTVAFGTVLAPILDVANVNGQESVSVQAPCELTPGAAQMVVSVDTNPSTPFPVTVAEYAPGIFQTAMSDGTLRAVLVRQDGTFVSLENPARRGDNLRMFVTGLGQTTPALFTNEFDPLIEQNGYLVPQLLPVNASLVVGVDNGGVPVTWAGYAYGMVGVYEVDFQVPQSTAMGNNIPFAIAVYQGTNLVFGNGSLIPIQ